MNITIKLERKVKYSIFEPDTKTIRTFTASLADSDEAVAFIEFVVKNHKLFFKDLEDDCLPDFSIDFGPERYDEVFINEFINKIESLLTNFEHIPIITISHNGSYHATIIW